MNASVPNRFRKMHAEHVPLSATAKRLRLRRLRLGVTRGVGAAMASCTWSDEETFVLIEIWGEDSIQAMLEGTRRKQRCLREDCQSNRRTRVSPSHSLHLLWNSIAHAQIYSLRPFLLWEPVRFV